MTERSSFAAYLRGAVGGLVNAYGATSAVLNATGCDIVIVETLSVGQNEVDIVRHAQTVVLLESPGAGDAVQAGNAGLMEIGDVYVVNRADQNGAPRHMQQFGELLANSMPCNGWSPAVIATYALNGTGIAELRATLDARGAQMRIACYLNRRVST